MVEVKTKNPEKVLKGKKARAQGAEFEKRVRADLESKKFVVDKWSNNVDLELGKLVQAKPKYLFLHGRMQMVGNSSGFPDFVVWHKDLNSEVKKQNRGENNHCVGVVGVESKMDGKLDAAEKKKCKWLLDNGIFIKILIASKTKVKNKIVVEYKDFEAA